MWWREKGRVLGRMALALAVAGSVAACFQPMYAERIGPNDVGLAQKFRSVDIARIPAPDGTPEARMAVEVRNALLFDLTGGSGGYSPTHRLDIALVSQRLSVIVNVNTARPDLENYGLNASYNLVELATGKSVIQGSTFARVSYDIPGGEQRFARTRGLRDAENRAAKVIAENIRNRLASYFVAGT